MNPLVFVIKLPIRAYRLVLSPWVGRQCRFHPTCSAYALAALERHGALRGLLLAAQRILRCHPWARGGADPVPARFAWRDLIGYKRGHQSAHPATQEPPAP